MPAVYDVQQSLGASSEWATWLITIYLMVATVATPAMGRLGDLHGRRRMLLIGLAVFAIASVGAALSPALAVLIVFRAVQGIGGAVYPLALAIALDNRPRATDDPRRLAADRRVRHRHRNRVVGGGWLAQDVSWRAIFGAGAALVVLALVAAVRGVPDTGDRAGGAYDFGGTTVWPWRR